MAFDPCSMFRYIAALVPTYELGGYKVGQSIIITQFTSNGPLAQMELQASHLVGFQECIYYY